MSTTEKTLEIPGSILDARNITYNDTNVQNAIAEINTKIENETNLREEADNEIRTSTENTLYNTKPGGLRMKMKGNTEQNYLTGKNKFDINGEINMQRDGTIATEYLNTVSNNIITVANNNEASRSRGQRITGVSNLTITISLDILSFGTGKGFYLYIAENGTTIVDKPYTNLGKIAYTHTCNSDDVIVSFQTINGENAQITNIQIEEGTEATEHEEYCGNQPSPNPEYKQSIMNTGDCVEMIQGYYLSSNGTYSNVNMAVCNKYKIPCKENDIIRITTEKAYKYMAAYYNESGTFLSYKTVENVADSTFNVPSGVSYFNFDIISAIALTPQTVGKISLTVNGKHVTQIREVGKNLAKYVSSGYGIFDENTGVLKSTTTENTIVNGIKIQLFNNSTYVYQRKYIEYTGKIIVDFQKSNNFNILKVVFNSDSKDSTVTFDVSHLINGKIYYVQYNIDEFMANGGTISNVMITENPEYDEQYEPYREHIATIYTEQPIRESDVLFKDETSRMWTVERNVTEVVINKNANFADDVEINEYGIANHYVYLTNNKYLKKPTNKCTHLLAQNTLIANTTTEGFLLVDNSGVYLRLKSERVSTVEDLKELLTSNPFTFQLQLNTPTYEILDTASQLALNSLKTFNDVTRIAIDSRVQPEEYEWEFGTSQVGARVIRAENENDTLKIQLEDAINTMLLIGAQ